MSRPIYWLYLVSIALFVSGIGFLVTSARMREPPRVEAPITKPVASVKQIMQGIVDPATNVVFGAVSSTSTKAGVIETAPKTDREWELVGNSAAALVESGNLLTMGTEVVSRFTVRWEQVAGTTYHPWGDVVTVVGFLDNLHDDWGSERFGVEDMLARAVAELAG